MIERTEHGTIAVLRLAHGKASTLDVELCRGLIGALASEMHGPSRAVVLTGTGAIFSAGVDLLRVTHGGVPYLRTFLPLLSTCLRQWFGFPKPVVAAVNGHAIAGGCLLAACADHRVMTTGTGTIGVPELHVGVPFPSAALEVLRFLLPPHRLQEVLYTGTGFAADAALARGLVDELCAPEHVLARALAVAAHFASVPAAAFALTKRAVRLPALERIAWHEALLEREIAATWENAATLEFLRGYVARTLRK